MSYADSDERTNCCKISMIIVDVCTDVLRYLLNEIITNSDKYSNDLDKIHCIPTKPPLYSSIIQKEFNRSISNPSGIRVLKYADLTEVLKENRESFEILNFDADKNHCIAANQYQEESKVLKFYKCDASQLQMLYPNGEPARNANKFDQSTCLLLLRFLLKWPDKFEADMPQCNPPPETDYSIQADIKRLFMIRNDYYVNKPRFRCDSSQLLRLEDMKEDRSYDDYSVLAKIECVINRLVKDKSKLRRFCDDIDVILDSIYSKREHIDAIREFERENVIKFEKGQNEYKKTVICVLTQLVNRINDGLDEMKRNDLNEIRRNVDLITQTSNLINEELFEIKNSYLAKINKKISKLDIKAKSNVSLFSLNFQILLFIFCVVVFSFLLNSTVLS
jgi:hypothetical protein